MERLDRTALVPTVLFNDKLWEHYAYKSLKPVSKLSTTLM